MRYFHDLFSGVSHRDELIFFGYHRLILSFNLIVDVCFSDKSLLFYNFVLEDLNFFDLRNELLYSDYLLFYCRYFSNLFLEASSVNDFVNKLIDNFILSNNYWLFSSDLHEFRHFDDFFDYFFHLIDFRDFVFDCHNLVLMDWHLDKSFFDCCNWYSFFLANLNFFYLLAYLSDFLFNFFDLLMNYYFFFNPRYLFNSSYLFNYFYAFFNCFRHFFDLLYFLFDHHQLLDYLLTRDRHFEGNNHSLLDLNNLFNFYPIGNDLVNADLFRNLHMPLDNFIFLEFHLFYFFFGLCYWHNLLFDNFDSLNLSHWDVLDTFNLNNFLDDYRYFHFFDNLNHFLDLYDSIHDFLNDLRYLNNFLDNSRYNNNFLYNFLDFDDFGNFDHFFNYFVNMYSDLFYLFDNFRNLNYLLNQNFHRYFFLDVFDDRLWYLKHLGNFDYSLNNFLDLDNFLDFANLRHYLFNDFLYSNDFFLNDRYLNSFLNNLLNFLTKGYNFFDNFFHFFNSILEDNLFLDYLDFLDSRHFLDDFYNFLDYLWNFLNLLDCLNDGHYFFNDLLDDLRNSFYMVDRFFSRLVLDSVHNLLHYLLDFDYHWLLNNSLNYFLDTSLDFFYPFFYFLYNHSLLLADFNLFDFWDSLVYNFLNDNRLFHLHDLLFNDLDFNDFRNLHSSFNNFLNDLWYFYQFFLYLFHFYNLLHNFVNVLYHFDWNVNHLLNLFDLCVSYYLLYATFDGHNCGNLDYSFNNFLDDLGNLDDLVINLEAF